MGESNNPPIVEITSSFPASDFDEQYPHEYLLSISIGTVQATVSFSEILQSKGLEFRVFTPIEQEYTILRVATGLDSEVIEGLKAGGFNVYQRQ